MSVTPQPSATRSAATPPRCALVLSGHIMDAPERTTPRFPAEHEAAVRARIATALDKLEAGPADVAYTQGAAGADLMLAEAALERGVRLQLRLPFPPHEFVRRSILPATHGVQWRARFAAVLARLDQAPQVLAPAPEDAATGPFERCNRWLLDSAAASGARRLVLLCVWNGEAGDGGGGTADMVAAVRERAGEVIVIPP